MNSARELQLLIEALRVGAIEPANLVEAAHSWPNGREGFVFDLLKRGILDRAKIQVGAASTATFAARETPEWNDPLATKAQPALTPVIENAAPNSDADFDWSDRVTDRYALLAPHRIGGLGEVWLAQDKAIGRQVALKTIRAERLGHASTRARFVREARLTGRLEHPSIVPLYDLIDPPDGGPPYYAMRFVAGRTLAEAIGDFHQACKAGTASRLDFGTLLDAFVSVCHAVAFAHSRNILHRDLKGPNIVIGEFGEVFLLDWGLAKEMHDIEHPGSDAGGPGGGAADSTSPGSIMGTPAFMSPELVQGEPATKRSDVYALGAILYTILSGKNPYEGSNETVMEQVKTSEPPPPETANPAAPPALAAVCRKAMARDPQARYSSAEEIATEVRRWLADEPVAAYPEPWLARAARWARRHRTGVALFAVFLLTALVGLAITATLVWREKEQVVQEKKRVVQEKKRADDYFTSARSLLADTSARIAALETGGNDPRQVDQERLRTLQEIMQAFESFRTELPEDVQLQVQTALINRYTANLARLLFNNDSAGKSYASSIGIWEKLAKDFPKDARYRDNLSQILRDFGVFQKRDGKLRDAIATLDRSGKIAETLDEPDLENPLSEFAVLRTRGVLLLDRSGVDFLLGNFKAAEANARNAVELLDRLSDAPKQHSTPRDPLLAAIAGNTLAIAQREGGKIDEAVKTHADVMTRYQKLTATLKDQRDGLTNQALARDFLFNEAIARIEQAHTWTAIAERREAAFGELRLAMEVTEKLIAEYPALLMYKEGRATAFLRRGELYAAMDKVMEASADFQKAEDLFKELNLAYGLSPDYPGWRGIACLGLARAKARAGQPSEAKALFDKTGKLLEQAQKRNPDNHSYRQASEQLKLELKAVKP